MEKSGPTLSGICAERYRTDLVGGSEALGIHELHRTYIGGLKLAPAAPTMLDLRDAMLQDDLLRNPDAGEAGGSENYCRLWEGFAARGMGESALDTNDTGINAVFERFNLPASCGSATPPPDGDPSGLSADSVASHQIVLDWTDNASNELGHIIERCVGDGCLDFSWLTSVAADAEAYSDGGLQEFTFYRYRLFAFNDGGDSSFTNIGQAVTEDAPGVCGLPQRLVLLSSTVLDEQLQEACLSIDAGPGTQRRSHGRADSSSGSDDRTQEWIRGSFRRLLPGRDQSRARGNTSLRMATPDLSLVIPCFNEAAVIRDTATRLADEFRQAGVDLELILVDNGSSDTTGEIIRELAHEGWPVVLRTVEVNQGYGHGILTGLDEVRGNFVGFTCADGQVDSRDVLLVYQIAAGAYRLRLAKVRRRFRLDGLARKLVSTVYNLGTNLLFGGLSTLDINGNPKIRYKN